MSQKRPPIKMEPPPNWRQMIDNIRRVRKLYPAPVDSMGCDQGHPPRSDKTPEQRFQILLSLMLSSQTKDPITWAAVQKLKGAGLARAASLAVASEKDIEDLIFPVGFYRRKAVYLKEVARRLAAEHGGDIPASLEGLCKLKGVGPKMAHLCMQEAWNVNSGIGVDTHVHRISARLAWVPANTKTPEQTREALESWLPRDHWREINHLLVGFGQTICAPLRPKCGQCANSDICPSSELRRPATARSARKRAGRDAAPAVKVEPEFGRSTNNKACESEDEDESESRPSHNDEPPPLRIKLERFEPYFEAGQLPAPSIKVEPRGDEELDGAAQGASPPPAKDKRPSPAGSKDAPADHKWRKLRPDTSLPGVKIGRAGALAARGPKVERGPEKRRSSRLRKD